MSNKDYRHQARRRSVIDNLLTEYVNWEAACQTSATRSNKTSLRGRLRLVSKVTDIFKLTYGQTVQH